MSVGSYQRAASSNNSSTSNNGYDTMPSAPATTSGSVRLAGDNTKDRMYEPKHHQKAVRVLTVIAYIFFVSLAAITLSLYYLFIYHPPQPQPSNLTNQMFGSGNSGGSSYPSSVVINITDCKLVVAVMNRTLPTPPLETPRVLSVLAEEQNMDEERSTTEMTRIENRTASDNGVDNLNLTNYSYGGDYSKNINNGLDYYT